jgi:hypothetical protein
MLSENSDRPSPRATGQISHAAEQDRVEAAHQPGLFLANAPSPANATLEAPSLRTGKRTELVHGATRGRYLPPGRLVYASGGALLAAPFDRARLAVTGPALPVLEGVLSESIGGLAHFGVADDGTLVYVPARTQKDERSLVAVDRAGSARPLIDARHPYEDMDLSPDGRRLALTIEGPSWGIWVLEVTRGTLTRHPGARQPRSPLDGRQPARRVRLVPKRGVYRRHRPETTALYEVVRDNFETLCGAIDDGALAVRIPKHARRELEAYLDCGLPCRGFATSPSMPIPHRHAGYQAPLPQ